MRPKGIVLISVLLLSSVVAIFAVAMLKIGRFDLANSKAMIERSRAIQNAKGGLNHLAYRLSLDSSYNTDIATDDYEITFASTNANRSVNNLSSAAVASTTNYRGDSVYPHSADVLVVGKAGDRRVKVHAVLQRGLTFQHAAAAVGKVSISGNATLDGISSLADPTPVGGGIMSRYESTGPGDNAISWDGTGTFDMLGQSRLQTSPGTDPVSANLRSLHPSRIDAEGATENVPIVQVSTIVSDKSSLLPPDGVVAGPVGTLGHTAINDERYYSGDQVINGDLVLGEGSLFVSGDITINGGIHGLGSLVVDGNIRVAGGNSSLKSNQANGIALLSSGDVSLEGLPALGYLDSLASSHPAIMTARDNFSSSMATAKSLADSGDPSVRQAMSDMNVGPWNPSGNYWVNPIPGPDGKLSMAQASAPVPALTLAIKNSMGPAYDSDLRAQKIVHALEQIQQEHRSAWLHPTSIEAASPKTPDYRLAGQSNSNIWYFRDDSWDDDVLLNQPDGAVTAWNATSIKNNLSRFDALSNDHQKAAAGSNPMLLGRFVNNQRAFFANHPLDFSWLGRSYFQGVIYAGGDINVSNQFDVVGGLITQGNIDLSGGSRLVFNQEYNEFSGSLGPVTTILYEEL